jgi:hypothetical protein
MKPSSIESDQCTFIKQFNAIMARIGRPLLPAFSQLSDRLRIFEG